MTKSSSVMLLNMVALTRNVVAQLVNDTRSGAYHRHIAFENIQQLWQFIEAVLPEKASTTRASVSYNMIVMRPVRKCPDHFRKPFLPLRFFL